MKNLLCITAHPDDDTLFAGTLLKLKNKGWNIHEAILTGGEDGVSIKKGVVDLKKHRETEAAAFAKSIGIKKIYWLNGKDGFLQENQQIIEKLLKITREVKPSIVIILSANDYHKDHQASHQIGLSVIELASRNAYLSYGKAISAPLILVSDGLNLLEQPDIFVDISKEQKLKINALKTAYHSQMDDDSVRFSEGVALARGARIKSKYAEAFAIGKTSSRAMLSANNLEALKALLV